MAMKYNLAQILCEMRLVYTCTACLMVILVFIFGFILMKDTMRYLLTTPTNIIRNHKTQQLPIISKV